MKNTTPIYCVLRRFYIFIIVILSMKVIFSLYMS